ncbi:MAG: hypothetical protein ABR613_10710 [Actinomycetota bacterium]
MITVGHFADRFRMTPAVRLRDFDPESPTLQGPDPAVGAGTSLAGPVAEASDLAAKYPAHELLFVLVSDGILDDETAALDGLRALPGEIHLIALGAEPQWTASWPRKPPLTVQVLQGDTDLGEVARGIAEVWVRATRPPRPAGSPTASPSKGA